MNPVQVQKLLGSQLMLFSQSERPQHHAAIEESPRIGSYLMGGQVQIGEQLSDHGKKGETEACPEHCFVNADLVTV
jgi:hypothetical protein